MSIDKQIETWKKDGKRPQMVEFDDDRVAYFQSPTRKQMKLITSKIGNGGPVAMAESYIKVCYLGGDVTKEEILDENNTDYLNQMTATVDVLMKYKAATVKKL